MFSFLKKPFVFIPLIVLVGIIVAVTVGDDNGTENENTVVVSRNDLVQIVSVTGRVVPVNDAALAFEKGGVIASVVTEVGSTVKADQILVRLENDDVVAALWQAQAAQKAAEASLAETIRGSRPEEIALSEEKLKSAEQARNNSWQSVADEVREAYTLSDDAIYNKIDQLFSNVSSNMPTLNIPVTDFQLKTDIQAARANLTNTLVGWKDGLGSAIPGTPWLMPFASESLGYAVQVRLFLDKIALAVNVLTPNSSLSQTTIDAYKASVLTARTNLNTAIDGLNTAISSVNTAESNVAVAKRELDLKKAGSTAEAIVSAEAKVEEARAAVLAAEAQLAKTYLRAPFAGVVTKVNAVPGEIAPANTTLVSLISAGEFEIEANVPEADIAKIELGDAATTTLDAYSSDIQFPAVIAEIDPAETLVDNVPTYKVTLRFLSADPRIRSGMTVNIDVVTEERKGALVVPVRAVNTRTNGSRYVLAVGAEGSTLEKNVETGIRAEGGLIEILSGLSEGEQVILSR